MKNDTEFCVVFYFVSVLSFMERQVKNLKIVKIRYFKGKSGQVSKIVCFFSKFIYNKLYK